MAAKYKRPKKFKQARTDAKTAAKNTFSGKSQARLKDPTLKLTADDAKALNEVKAEARGNYITDAQGNKVQVKPTETAAERFRREHTAKAEEFRAQNGAAEPTKPAKTKKAATKKAAPKKTAAVEKPAVKKPTTTSKFSAGKSLNATGQARYDELIKQGVKPKSAMNKALFAQEKASKPAVKKAGATKTSTATKAPKGAKFTKITDASLTAQEDAYRQTKVDKLIKEGKLSGSKELAIRSKGELVKPGSKLPATRTQVATRIPGSDTVVKKGGKLKGLKKFGAISAAIAAATDAKNLNKSSNRLAQAQADLYAAKHKGKSQGVGDVAKNIVTEQLPTAGKQLAKYFSMGLIGEDASKAAARKEAELAKYKKSQQKPLRYGPNGESLVPGTGAYKKGSKTRPKFTAPSAGGTSPGAGSGSGGGSGSGSGGSSGSGSGGGSSSNGGAITSGAYIVKSGDTLSAIAKRAGVKLEDIYATNKKFKTNPKYKGGNMIWSGTKVNIPTKK